MYGFHGSLTRTIAVVVSVHLWQAGMAQTYTHPTVGQQSTYTGACMVTTCSGTYYDDGGAAGNYAPNVNNIFRTFCPNAAGMCVRATFSQFSMNDTWILCGGPGGCCDYLSILNGPVQNSPALWSNCIGSPGTITASNPSGCLTFRFVSDGSVQLPGWTATLSCVPCAGGPTGGTNSDCAFATLVCADASFSDASPGPGILAEGCSGCVTSENYTNWYRVVVQTGGTLAFTINPNNNADDFDPVVFGPNVSCGALGSPARCSYAINAGNGNTGLGNGAVDLSEGVAGDQWVAPMNVTAGQSYFVMINGWSATSGSNGFQIDWTGTANLNCTVLPVELLGFDAKCEQGSPLLAWATGAEINSDHFVVERSTDLARWGRVGVVEAAHYSDTRTDYVLVDPDRSEATQRFYRLRQVDRDGKEQLSEVVALNGCRTGGVGMQVAPNPTHTGVRITLDRKDRPEEVLSLELLDLTGRRLRVTSILHGMNGVELDLGTLPAGSYTLALRRADGHVVERSQVIKQ